MTDQYIIRTEAEMPRVGAAIRAMLKSGPVLVRWQSHKEKRRDAQNRLLWRWNGEIQAFMREHHGQLASAEEWHEVMCRKLRPVQVRTVMLPTGDEEVVGRWRSSEANVGEMAEYLTDLDAYCAELGLLLSHSTDDYHAAMMSRATKGK